MTKNNQRRSASPGEIALMDKLADDLTSGGVDTFLANEREWRGTPLAAFMAGQPLDPEPPALDAVGIFAKWNSKAAPSAPVNAPPAERPQAITDLNPTAIYAKWNGSGSRREALTDA